MALGFQRSLPNPALHHTPFLSNPNSNPKMTSSDPSPNTYTCVVTGGTGAIGRELVAELLASPAWSRITVVGRSKWTVPPNWTGKIDLQEEEKRGRLVQRQVDMEALSDSALKGEGKVGKEFFEGCDAAFCVLGTTHSDAGSSAAFRRVDLDYVKASAVFAKASGVQYFSHVTASGTGGFFANLTNYGRTKAAAETAIKELGFPAATIFRPGMLDREDKLRTGERWLLKVIPGIKVGAVAKEMRLDAEETLGKLKNKGGEGVKAWKVVEDADISR